MIGICGGIIFFGRPFCVIASRALCRGCVLLNSVSLVLRCLRIDPSTKVYLQRRTTIDRAARTGSLRLGLFPPRLGAQPKPRNSKEPTCLAHAWAPLFRR